MRRVLRRWLIAGLAMALLAGACSDGGEQAADEGSRPANAPTPLAPEVSTLLASAPSTLGAPGVPTLVAPGVSASVVAGASAPAALGEAGPGPDTNLTIRLSEGNESDGESSPTVGQVEGEVLSDEEIRAVIDRLPPWDGDDGGAADFNRPVDSLPPPRTGTTVDEPFPAGPDIAAPVVDPGPLEVLRVQPEGEVGIAPFVSITFNQPMVPLATISQLGLSRHVRPAGRTLRRAWGHHTSCRWPSAPDPSCQCRRGRGR